MGEGLTRRQVMTALAASGGLAAWALPRRLSWAARGAEGSPLRLLFYTDVHARPEWDTPLALSLAADSINAQRADLVIAGGDLITDGFQSSAATAAPRWDVYMAMQRAIRPEVQPVIGNHDLVAAIPEDGTPPSPDPRSIFLELMGLQRTYRSFDALGYHVVLLDSVQVVGGPLKYNGHVSAEQLDWLRQDLARLAPATPVICALHIPLLTAFYAATEGATAQAPNNRVVVNSRAVLDILDQYNTVLVLQGHIHVKELIRWRNTAFITGGAICGRWWRGPWHGTEAGYNVVTLRQDRVDWDYIGYGWQPRRPKDAALRADGALPA